MTFVPIIEALADKLPQDMRYVVMTDRTHMPNTTLDLLCYEDLLDPHPTQYDCHELPDEPAWILCYTSGYTGNPTVAPYLLRTTVFHARTVNSSYGMTLQEVSATSPVSPLSHVPASVRPV